MKGQIADMMEGQGTGKGKKAGAGSRFSVEELKELFKLRLDTASDTLDLLCKGSADKGTSRAVLGCAELACASSFIACILPLTLVTSSAMACMTKADCTHKISLSTALG